MNVFPIHNDMDYNKAMSRVDALMEANDGAGPEAGSQEGDELEVLAMLAERYEEERFPLDLPSPVEAVKFAME